MSILIIDNYDSFTYNLVQYVKELTSSEVVVKRNDEIDLQEVSAFEKILISPGPGLPENAGIIKSVISEYGASKPILGICLWMQAMAEVYGSELYNLPKVYHGLSSTMIIQNNDPIFDGIDRSTEVGRYHSWAMKDDPNPELEVLSRSEDGCIMAIRHVENPVVGLQFHPESVLTPQGKTMIKNWLEMS